MNDPKAASIRQRLLNRARDHKEDYNQVLARYCRTSVPHPPGSFDALRKIPIEGSYAVFGLGGQHT